MVRNPDPARQGDGRGDPAPLRDFRCFALFITKCLTQQRRIAPHDFPVKTKEPAMNATADIRTLPHVPYKQLDTRFDPEYGAYWALMQPRPRACFNAQLLADLRTFIDGIVRSEARIQHKGQDCAVNYAVLASKTPGVFNLGGDLALFRSAIESGNREALQRYADQCIDDMHPWNRNFDLPVTTISLVQGEALGGGFEAALASSVLIAEESSRMGFPEILFNMFPGMGAYSFLSRKVGRRVTEELITSGAVYTTRQLFDMGVVDVIAPDGMGEAAVIGFIRKHARAANGRRGIEAARREVEPITRDELDRVVGVWVDAALKLTPRDLKMMERLVRAQQRSAEDEDDAAAAGRESNVVRLEAVGAGD
jgi:DSF synthase